MLVPLLVLPWLAGCASTRGEAGRPGLLGGAPEAEVRSAGLAEGGEASAAPWEIPEADWGTQRILLTRYRGPEGDGTLRLVLRLVNPDRFQVTASDRLGRRWWELHLQDGVALVLWVRERTFCRHEGDIEIPALSLGPVPAGAVAALLLWRLPAPPVDPAAAMEQLTASPGHGAEPSAVALEYRDARERRWTSEVTAGGPVRWTLWRTDRERASWSTDGKDMARLTDADTGLTLTWRQRRAASELVGGLPTLAPPSGFVSGDCRDRS